MCDKMFAPCLNPATVSGLGFAEVAALAAANNIGHIEVSIQQVVAFGPDKAVDLLDRLGIQVAAACGLLPDGPVLPHPLLVDETTYQLALDGLAGRLHAFQTIRCPVATLVVNPRTDLPLAAARELAISRLRRFAADCALHGVTLAVEPVGVRSGLPPSLDGRNEFVTDLPQLQRLLDDAGGETLLGAVSVCVDSFHWAVTGANPAHLAGLDPWRIGHVQIADIPHKIPAGEWTDAMRLFPGDGALPWQRFVRGLETAGYGGPVSVELFNPDLRRLPEDEIACHALSGALLLGDSR